MSHSPQSQQGRGAGDVKDERLAFEVRGGLDAALAARRAVAEGDGWIPPAMRGDVLLLLTELITNAVRHGGVGPEQSLSSELRWRAGALVVEVRHPKTRTPVADIRPDGSSKGGWGLFMVDEIAHQWGVTHTSSATTVWFELHSEQ